MNAGLPPKLAWTRWLLGTAAAALVAASFAVPTAPLVDGGRTLEGWAVAMVGVALGLLAVGVSPPWRRAAGLAAFFALATSSHLAITATHWLQSFYILPWFPEPELPSTLQLTLFLAKLSIVAQVIAVSWMGRGHVRDLAALLRAVLTPLRAAVVLLVFAACAVHVTPYLPRDDWGEYALQLGFTIVVVLANLGHLALIAASLPREPLAEWCAALHRRFRFPADGLDDTAWDRRVPWLLAGWVAVVSTIVAWFVLERLPHIPDEIAYLFQARCLAAGILAAPAPPLFDPFEIYLVTSADGQWFGVTNPGWPALLALGCVLGAPWVVNPLLGALSILMLHRVARRWTDTGTAHVVTLLAATSPWLLFLSASYMTHPSTVFLGTGAWLLLARVRGGGNPLLAFPAGLAVGWIVLVRPMEGLVLGGATGLLAIGLFGKRLPWSAIVAYGLGCVAGASVLLLYNVGLAGDAFAFPISGYLDEQWGYENANRLGFGPRLGPGDWGILDPYPSHYLSDVLINANQNLYNLNFELFGWAVGSLLLLTIHLVAGRWSGTDRFALLVCAGVVVGYSFYWFSGGPDFGARYWYALFVPVVWLSGRGLTTLRDRLASVVPDAGARLTVVVGLLVLLTIVSFLPWRCVGRYLDYRGFHGDYRQLAASGRLENGLVFVRSRRSTDWGSAFDANPPTLDADRPVFARDLDPETNARLVEAYPERPVWIVAGRSVAGGRSRVVAGPLPPGTPPPEWRGRDRR